MTYDYECNNCGHIQEEIHDAHAQPEIKCEKCQGCSMKRIITGGTGFSLKGSDWCSSGRVSLIKKKEKS